jgi:hypothetical protein
MKITRSELLDVVYRFYPRGLLPYARIHVPPGEPFYDDTEEYLRLVEAANHGRAEYPTWKAMIRRLGDRYGLQNESLSLLSGNVDPAYSARIWLTDETALSFHVSLLGPYYGIHLPGIPEEEPVAREIAREIEATYPGYRQVPPELGDVVVPDVTMFAVSMGEATIGMFLFSVVWSWIDPVPWRHGKGSMKYTQGELLDIVYRYYPRGVGIVDGDLDVQAIRASEEHARLVAVRRKAATDERWPAMRRRIEEHFPDASLTNHSLHLPTGDHDACYSFAISLPGATNDRMLWFQVSFLAPCYVIHGSSTTDIMKEPREDSFSVIFEGLHFQVARSRFDPELISNVDDERRKLAAIKKRYVNFDLLPNERPYVEWIAHEIEATFGCEPLPPEVGAVLVSDLATPKLPGEVRLYDCLFSENEWVKPSPADMPALDACVDPSHLTEPFLATLTVLAALYRTFLFLSGHRKGYCVVSIEGILRKEDGLNILAGIRRLIESPVAPCGIAAKGKLEGAMRKIEALVAAWDGNGAPSDAMVAWASSFLAGWDGGEDGGLRED